MYNPQLETFIRVADAGSFNKAAEESYIADSYYLQVYTAKQSETSLEVSFFL